jgi:hypothetical protein
MNWRRRLVSPKVHVNRCPQPSIWDRVASEKWHPIYCVWGAKSEMGHFQTPPRAAAMSAPPSIADIAMLLRHVRFVQPTRDIR